MQDDVAGPRIGQDCGRDRGHAAGEDRGRLRGLVDRQTIFDDLAVRVIEARIDQPGSSGRTRLPPAGREVKEVPALLGRAEHEGRGQEHRLFDRPFGQSGIVAVAQHQSLGMEQVVADPIPSVARFCHGSLPSPGAPRACHPPASHRTMSAKTRRMQPSGKRRGGDHSAERSAGRGDDADGHSHAGLPTPYGWVRASHCR